MSRALVLTTSLLGLLVHSTADAATIAFNPLVAPNGTPYTGHSEVGFNVAPTFGNWNVGQAFGNPTPSIFGGPIGAPVPSEIAVTEAGGGTFVFSSAEIVSNNGRSQYFFDGFLGGMNVLSQTGFIGANLGFAAILNTIAPGQLLDRLEIGIVPLSGTSSFNVDNINVTAAEPAVPEPTSMALFGLTALGFGVGFRRRRKGEAVEEIA
jgi:hypothetical protein